MESMAVFDCALRQMKREGACTFGPISFNRYLRDNGLAEKRTWQYVSVDSLDRLAPELRQAQTMVFRLGGRKGNSGTHFGLARCRDNWSDFFFQDNELLQQTEPEVYLPEVSVRTLFSFQLLPKLTETSLVNLAIGSGLLPYVLGLETGHGQLVPATGQSTFTFHIVPLPGLPTAWEHINGQVEIDALFFGRRAGRETLFLIEGKCGRPQSSIAKHKLAYPLAALRNSVPEYIDIVPVYVKTWGDSDGQHFLVVECACPKVTPVVIAELGAVAVWHLVLNGYGGRLGSI